jgi:hypothetical protein
MELNKTSQIFNLTQIKINYGSFTLKNVAIEIVVNNPNRTILSNYTIDHVYSIFGIFAFNIISSFGGNLFSPSRTFVNVQRIQAYPFKQIEINQFDLNCTLNELSLDCILRINISNYANSFQSISIDFDDGGINTSFILNSYCNLMKIKIILNRFMIKFNFFYKDVPNSIISSQLNSAAFPFNAICLFNNYVQTDSKISAIEFYANSLSAISSFRIYVG